MKIDKNIVSHSISENKNDKDVNKSENEIKIDNNHVKEKMDIKSVSNKGIISEKEVKPKQNIFFSALNNIWSVAKKTIYKEENIQKTEMEFVQEENSEIAKDFSNALVVLDESEKEGLSLKIRMKCAPNRTSSGCSGSYFLKTATNLDPNKPEELKDEIEKGTAMLKDSFIIKPTIQEVGAKGYPDGMLGSEVNQDSEGVEPGKGAIREKMGDLVQKHIGLDFGIPSTGMAKVKSRQLGLPTKGDLLLRQYTKKWNMKLTPQIFVKLCGDECDPKTFKKNMIEKIELEIEELGGKELLNDFNLYFNEIAEKKIEKLPPLPKELEQIDRSLQGQLTSYAQVLFEVKYSKELDSSIETIWNELNSEMKSTESLASFQKLADGCVGLNELQARNQADWICPKEFEKFAIDIVLLNMDRHEGNVLAKEVSKEDLIKRLVEMGVDSDALELAIKEMMDENKDKKLNQESHLPYVQKFLDSLPKELRDNEKIESGINNLFYAEANQYETTFELVLIDHGSSLPDPDLGLQNLTTARFCWAYMPQGETKLSGLTKEKILSLNIDETINKVKQNQQTYAKRYGKECEVSNACYHLMKLNMIVLKKMAKLNVPLKEANMIIKGKGKEGKEVQSIFKEHIQGVKNIDWKKIDQLVEEAIKSRIKEGG